jgi:hypothetical protein
MSSSKRQRQIVLEKKVAREASRARAALRVGPNQPARELVKHPYHYNGDTPHEVIKCLEAWGLEFDALLWNAVKYIARSGKKGSAVTDLEKARFYIDRRIETLRAAAGLSQCPAKTKERP